MTLKLLVATHNPGKVREYRELLADLPLELTYLDPEGITLDVEETGQTFAENARLKAVAYAQMSGLLTWADDSGLEVDALGGAPGVYSARYAGPGASDADRYRKLLDALAGVPWNSRTARFRCTVAIAVPPAVLAQLPGATPLAETAPDFAGPIYLADGAIEGIVAFGPAGDNGFGYDPIFYLPEQGVTLAQLPSEVKNRVSHRGSASQVAREILARLLG
jgi:XTP/dITP diphosphohydrolase